MDLHVWKEPEIIGAVGSKNIGERNMEGFRPRELGKRSGGGCSPTVTSGGEIQEHVLLTLTLKRLFKKLNLFGSHLTQKLTRNPMIHNLKKPPFLRSSNYIIFALFHFPHLRSVSQTPQINHRKLPFLHRHSVASSIHRRFRQETLVSLVKWWVHSHVGRLI